MNNAAAAIEAAELALAIAESSLELALSAHDGSEAGCSRIEAALGLRELARQRLARLGC